MGKEDLIVDNPLLLTSLFGKGVFALRTEIENKEIAEESETVDVDSTKESSEEKVPLTEAVEVTDEVEVSKIQIPQAEVLHLVVETGNSPYFEETIPNAMKAIGKLLNVGSPPEFAIIDVLALDVAVQDYVNQIPKTTKIVFWGNETELSKSLTFSQKQVLKLCMPSVMLSSNENKAEHWAKIKSFFNC